MPSRSSWSECPTLDTSPSCVSSLPPLTPGVTVDLVAGLQVARAVRRAGFVAALHAEREDAPPGGHEQLHAAPGDDRRAEVGPARLAEQLDAARGERAVRKRRGANRDPSPDRDALERAARANGADHTVLGRRHERMPPRFLRDHDTAERGRAAVAGSAKARAAIAAAASRKTRFMRMCLLSTGEPAEA